MSEQQPLHFSQPLPLSLYVHLPWCVRKCPYCDFNSHRAGRLIPEQRYIEQLINDLDQDLEKIWQRPIRSIFIGGGTPSLFSAQAIDQLLQSLHSRLSFLPQIEITMEANPGTVEQQKFSDFHLAGINRLSIGIQSFQDDKLKALGRIHNGAEAKKAIDIAQKIGFEKINIDLMHGLPQQSCTDVINDLQTAIIFAPSHLSWYQLTLEPNTVFAKHPPTLPQEKVLWQIQQQGDALLNHHHYDNYEISAYCRQQAYCHHNLNYWLFGDYLGIGAGAHSKITDLNQQKIIRFHKQRNPRDYLNIKVNDNKTIKQGFIQHQQQVTTEEVTLEFMMNSLRLSQPISFALFEQRTSLTIDYIQSSLQQGQDLGLLQVSGQTFQTTDKGRNFLNDCLQLFN